MSALTRIECTIEFPLPAREIRAVDGTVFQPVKITYSAYLYAGRIFVFATVFGIEHDNANVPLHDNGYPPMPDWFKQVTDQMRAAAKEAVDA